MPALDPDDQLLLEPLRSLGAEPTAAVWDDPAVDWSSFALVVIRNTWDYTSRRTEFVAWADSVPRLVNPAGVVEWNTDKRYLADLAAAGVSVVPTTWVTGRHDELPATGAHVLKPAVGAGSLDAQKFALHDAHEAALARAHAERLLAAGQTVMIQPYVEAVDVTGETGVIFVGGTFSHAISKGAMLAAGRDPATVGLYLEETITARLPTTAELELAGRALEAVPGGPGRLAYARVDMVPGPDGQPMLMELELTEPSLFMATAPGSADRFASVIASMANQEAGRAPQRSKPGLSRRERFS